MPNSSKNLKQERAAEEVTGEQLFENNPIKDVLGKVISAPTLRALVRE